MKSPLSFRLVDVAALGLVGGQLVGSVLAYARLPERFPIHFDIHGTADGFASRPVGAFLMPCVSLALWTFVRTFPRRLTGEARTRALASPLAETALLVTGLSAGLHFVMLDVALSGSAAAGRGLGFVLASFTLALGLLLPKLRRNGIAGIRTPYTLSSDETWQKTHRIGGIFFFAAGVVGLVGTAMGSVAVVIGALVVATLASVVYSFLTGRPASLR
jgi:uncharacterized membrane protein